MGKIDGSAGLAWTPDGKIVYTSLLNNSISLWLMNSDGSAANQVTSSGFYDKFPKMPKDSRHIVFQSNRSGGSEIWRVNADGSDLRQLTQGGRNSTPDVTPDGSWVLYAVNERGASTIWRISIDGGTPVRLTNAQSSWPQVSPDGKYFACAYADRTLSPATQLAVFPLAGGQPFTHFAVQGGAELSNGIHWSPDNGSLIYRDLGAGLWRQSLAGGAPQKLPDLPDRKIWFCDWSMDGKQLALAYGEEMRDVVLLANFR
jgi:Tol biopolymer transport system component